MRTLPVGRHFGFEKNIIEATANIATNAERNRSIIGLALPLGISTTLTVNNMDKS
jgi:hypothetical protein